MNQNPVSASKLLSGRAMKMRIGLVCVAILVVGAWLAPPRTSPLSAGEELAAPLLEEQVQSREIAVPFRGVEDIAERIAVRGFTVQPVRDAAVAVTRDFAVASAPATDRGFAIAVGDTDAVSHIDAIDGDRDAQLRLADGRSTTGTVIAFDAPTGLVLLRAASAVGPAATLAPSEPPIGALVVGASAWPDGQLILPAFVTAAAADGGRTIAPAGAPGLPMFNADGQLVGIAGRGGALTPARAVIERLRGQAAAANRPAAIGIVYHDVTGPLRDVIGADGAIVARVVAGGPADRSGIREGDVIVAFGDTPVTSAHALDEAQHGATAPEITLTVRRAGRNRVVTVTRGDAYDVAALARHSAETAAAGVAARSIFTAATLTVHHLSPASLVISIAGRTVASPAEAQREISRQRRAFPILVDDRGDRFFVAMEPAP